jgi:hypothetical protein
MTPMHRVGAMLLLAGAVSPIASCRDRAPVAPAADGRAPAGVLQPSFEPPADRLLTDRHLDLYVKVRRGARDRSEADAARALGEDPDELAWVRARIVEALVALDETRVRQASAATYDRTIASLRTTLKNVRDAQTARTIQGEIAALERERSGMRNPDPLPIDIAANARKVAGRRAELEAVLE